MNRNACALAAVGLFAASCGSGSPADSNPFESTNATVEAPTTVANTAESASGPQVATSLEEVRSAIVRIVGTGTFAEPGGDVQVNVPGSGSGFIINPSGIAVTNNHVVTGAGLIEVYVGDDTEPRNARVLGVSECSDLAVIDIDGEGFDSLAWAESSAKAGSEIFAVGFPLGDSEYTVLDGVISKEQVAGADSWASVDAVVEHSADTLPGNSGGPIVGSDGKVLAVNYAGNEAGQSFAIGLDVAQSVAAILEGGVDHESIGVNGEAFSDGSTSGIWVYSVKSGSPADVAGVRSGDVLMSMEGVLLAEDGTMADYCDVLRSHMATDVLGIEVYRSATDEIMEGQINGRQLTAIAPAPLPPVEPVEPVPPVPPVEPVPVEPAPPVAVALPPGTPYTQFVTITDDSNLIEMSVPVEWSDVDGRLWTGSDLAPSAGDEIGPALSASPSLDAWRDTWETPGVFLGASPYIEGNPQELLDRERFDESCTDDGRFPYDDGLYTGWYDQYINCGVGGSEFMVAMVQPADKIWTAMLQITLVTEADRAAATTIIETFMVEALAG